MEGSHGAPGSTWPSAHWLKEFRLEAAFGLLWADVGDGVVTLWFHDSGGFLF